MLLVKSAQSDAIEALADDGTYLFSASDDGSIQVWNLQTGDIVQRIQIADLPIVKLAAEPGGLLSVLEKKRDNSFRLSEWEWKTAHRRFSVDLVDPPLFMTYSPQASFLVCALPRWNSLVFFDSSTGTQLPWPGDGFGIVDYALVSSKEERIMTYQSSTGVLSYRNLSNGAEITRFTTRQGLRNFQVVPDQTKTRAFASDGNNIVLVDLLSGSVLDSRPLPSPLLAILSSDSSGARAVALLGSPSSVLAQTFTVTDKPALAPQALEKMTFKNTMTSATLAASQIFAGDGNGFVFRDLGKDSKAALADQIINPIVGLAASDSAIYLSSPGATIKIATDLFSSAQAGVASRFDYRLLSSVPSNQGMTSLSATSILLWDRSRAPKISILSTNNDSVTRSSPALPSRLLRVNAGKDYAVSVESSGQIRTWSVPDLKQGFTRNVLGALDADFLPDGSLLVGKGSSSALDSPLLKINPRTGETVPVPSTSQAVFLVKDSSADGLVYLMSIDGQAQGSVTSLQSWNPTSGLVEPKALSSFQGEDLDADLVIPSQPGGAAYLSAGRNALSEWDGSRTVSLEGSRRIPRQVSQFKGFVFSINADGSASIWDSRSTRLVANLILFTNGTAALLIPGQAYIPIGPAAQASSVASVLSVPVEARDSAHASFAALSLPAHLFQ